MGIPLTAGFIGDILIFIGAYGAFGLFGIIPVIGILIIAAALLWLIERSFLKGGEQARTYREIDGRVVAGAILLLAGLIIMGVFPFLLLSFQSII